MSGSVMRPLMHWPVGTGVGVTEVVDEVGERVVAVVSVLVGMPVGVGVGVESVEDVLVAEETELEIAGLDEEAVDEEAMLVLVAVVDPG
jgi:hypothetical protein